MKPTEWVITTVMIIVVMEHNNLYGPLAKRL